MKFRNIDNWKTEIKKKAKEKNLDIQDVQQRYVLEEFASKISASKYREQLVLKGGFVVSTLLGLDTRTTRDIDLTCRTTIYSEKDIKKIIQEILITPTDSFFEYSLLSVRKAQKEDYYSGYIVMLNAKQDKTEIKLKLDISNNTLIYPKALRYKFISLFDNEPILLNTYALETIIAEKFETTLDRGEFNGRIRDLVDIYLLMNNNKFMIDNKILADTIIKVSKDKGTIHNLYHFDSIIISLSESEIFNQNFKSYLTQQYPDLKINLDEILDLFKQIYQIVKDSLCINQ